MAKTSTPGMKRSPTILVGKDKPSKSLKRSSISKEVNKGPAKGKY